MSDKLKGIYKGDELSNDQYHGEKEHLSSSNLKMLLKDPAQFYDEKILNNKIIKDIPAFAEGSLVHGMILEPHLVDEEFVCFDGFRKIGKQWDAFKAAETAGKNRTILSKPQFKRCEGLVKGFNQNKTAVELVKSCDKELSLFLELDEVPLKVRADCINIEEGYIADIKTTSFDTDIDSFKYTIQDFNYDLSAALYCRLFEEHFGKKFDFYWIVLGKKDRSCEIYKMSDKSREKGNRQVFESMQLYKQCKKTEIWRKKKVDILADKCYDDYEILEI